MELHFYTLNLFNRMFYIVILFFHIFIYPSLVQTHDFRQVPYDDLQKTVDIFTYPNVTSYGQLLFDITNYQLIVGARDYLFRLTLEGLKKWEVAHWPAKAESIQNCHVKGRSEDECRNYVKVLVNLNGKIFSCGTNAFSPECSYRNITALQTGVKYESGEAKCPSRPDVNTTALMTQQGEYFIGTLFGFDGVDQVFCGSFNDKPALRTEQYNQKWLNSPNFIASYEIEDFVYFFFREIAIDALSCGKVVYSRVGRVCKNDQGGQDILKNTWTTFLKARLICTLPGDFPFYFNEIQSIHYLEAEQILYATFSTPPNSIYGSAICSYSVSSIHQAFANNFKYQSSPHSAWKKVQKAVPRHFKCEGPVNASTVLDSQNYQLMYDPVKPITHSPLYHVENERLSHIVVDIVKTKHYINGIHVIFVATVEQVIQKLVVLPKNETTCLIEELEIFPKGSSNKIKQMKVLKDTGSLYVGTETSVMSIPVQRCSKFKTKNECLYAMDPYCGWNMRTLTCTTAPQRNPENSNWLQERTGCPEINQTVNGGWSPWSDWFDCGQTGENNLQTDEMCSCQQRFCTNPSPANGGRDCEGISLQIVNCTRNGQWTEWSSWSPCSSSCDLGFKRRRRTCGNPAPAFGGKPCIGNDSDEIVCASNPPCPEQQIPPVHGRWSDWSTWEDCSKPCGKGYQVRRRRCNSPPPRNGGQPCIGCNFDFQTCNDKPCPEVRKASHWTPFFRVNATKEGYFEQRFRFICKAHVFDESHLKIGHIKKEERFCLEGSNNCLDAAFINLDGEWSEWSPWSTCSASCGGGTQYRERACDSPRPVGSGSDCVGLPRMDKACSTEPCPDDNIWEEWSTWSICDQNLEQHRTRRCKLLGDSRSECKGPTKEIRICLHSGPLNSEILSNSEDGIHASHVVIAFICGLIFGGLSSAFAYYYYLKRKKKNNTSPVIAAQLIPVKPNSYEENEWKNNLTLSKGEKIPLREATIKRNGNFRAQIQSDQNF